jgi:hypothetical protein
MPSPEESNAAMRIIEKFRGEYDAGGVGLPPGQDWVDTAFAYLEHAGVYDDEAQAKELLQGYGVLVEGDPPPPADDEPDGQAPEAPEFLEAMDLPEWWEAFRAFTQSEFSSEGPEFLDAVRYQTMEPQAICDDFVAPGSPHEVNISASQRAEIAAALADGTAGYEVFDAATDEVRRLLKNDTWQRFLKADGQ